VVSSEWQEATIRKEKGRRYKHYRHELGRRILLYVLSVYDFLMLIYDGC